MDARANGLESSNMGKAGGCRAEVVVLSQGDADTRLEGFAMGSPLLNQDLSLAELSARIASVLGAALRTADRSGRLTAMLDDYQDISNLYGR
jgi:hypothetical protein